MKTRTWYLIVLVLYVVGAALAFEFRWPNAIGVLGIVSSMVGLGMICIDCWGLRKR